MQNFFKAMVEFKQKQEQQKKRGLNDYNILTTVLKAHDEVRLHSRMIASLLDTKGKHYQNSLFFQLFLETLNANDFNIGTSNITVKNEFHNIDIYITDGSKHIIIENKIYAGDQEHQIKRYIDDIYKLNPQVSSDDILVVYLSIDRDKPSLYSLDDLEIIKNEIFNSKNEKLAIYKNMHYKTNVLNWLNNCKNEVQNITNLNEVFEQYIQVVRKITNQYKGKVMTLKDELKKNIEHYRVAEEIIKSMPAMKNEVIGDFFEEVIKKLSEALGEEWIVEKVGEFVTKYNFPLRIYKKEWKQQKNYILFGFEFDADNYYDGRFGLVGINNSINIQDIASKFKDEMSLIDINFNNSSWWLFNHKLPAEKNFVEQILFYDFNSDDYNFNSDYFVKKVLEYIEKIEFNGNSLLSKINAYLKEEEVAGNNIRGRG